MTQLDLDKQGVKEHQAADRKLNEVYTKILALHHENPAFMEALKKAQRQWILYRNAELESLYPGAAQEKTNLYGSVYPMCRENALTELTRRRTEELQAWLKGTEEGDVCAGSQTKP